MAINLNENTLIQSPYLYLQAVGSRGFETDNYPEGIMLRWDLMRNLGEEHLPKGNLGIPGLGFNKANDFIKVYRVPYVKQQIEVDFSVNPDNVVADEYLWVYLLDGENVFIRFKDTTKYNSISIDPTQNASAFVEAYGDGLIEVAIPRKLCFAAEIEGEKMTDNARLRIEGVSLIENTSSSEKYVSCRKEFDASSFGQSEPIEEFFFIEQENGDLIGLEAPGYLEYNESGYQANELNNGNFEKAVDFSSDYAENNAAFNAGDYRLVKEATELDSSYQGLPKLGYRFMMINSASANQIVWTQTVSVDANEEYLFSASVLNSLSGVTANLEVSIQGSNGLSQTFSMNTTTGQGEWELFSQEFNSGSETSVSITITNLDATPIVFGLDALYLGKQANVISVGEPMRIVSENMESIRFSLSDARLKKIRLESYERQLEKTLEANTLEDVGDFSLHYSDDNQDTTISGRLLTDDDITGKWPKYNDDVFAEVNDYLYRWDDEIKDGVKDFISMGNAIEIPGFKPDPDIPNPRGIRHLFEGDQFFDTDQVPEGISQVDVAYLDVLKLVSMDYHVARMLGLGHVDHSGVSQAADNTQYVYFVEYYSQGQLDLNIGGSQQHVYQSLPTAKEDTRMPYVPEFEPLSYGLYHTQADGTKSLLSDEQGYTPDGKARFVNLYLKEKAPRLEDNGFFCETHEFCTGEELVPILGGVEYSLQEEDWRQRELTSFSYTKTEIVNNVEVETEVIENVGAPYHEESERPFVAHRETEEGIHRYAPYGIDLFSRASDLGLQVVTDETKFRTPDTIISPSDLMVHLVQEEEPLFLTTRKEQDMLSALASEEDDTLLRVSFNYHSLHDWTYGTVKEEDGEVINHFGDEVEFFFREPGPRNIRGAIKSVNDKPDDETRSIVRTKPFTQVTNNEVVSPIFETGTEANFLGGVMVVNGRRFIVEEIIQGEDGPTFIVEKIKQPKADRDIVDEGTGTTEFAAHDELYGPDFEEGRDIIFMAIENMAMAESWDHQLSQKVTLGKAQNGVEFDINEEFFTDEEDNEIKRWTRGFWQEATITPINTVVPDETNPNGVEKFKGVYKVEFSNFVLPNHIQYTEAAGENSVNWYNGKIRVPKVDKSIPGHDYQVVEVIATENIGGTGNLILYIQHENFVKKEIETGVQTVNYYPGYKMYLHADPENGFQKSALIPTDRDLKQTILGARSRDTIVKGTEPTGEVYYSSVGPAAIIGGQRFIKPKQPERPLGALFATRPDYYGKSTYSMNVSFKHEPYSVAFYRANNLSVLRALYKESTVQTILTELDSIGDGYNNNRWNDLINVQYDQGEEDVADTGKFKKYGEVSDYRFPLPDNDARNALFDGVNKLNDTVVVINEKEESVTFVFQDVVKLELNNVFFPLTEVPLIYKRINGNIPVNEKQVIRSLSGKLLKPTDIEFKMGPMAQTSTDSQGMPAMRFVDYNLDGSANQIYFYMAREIGNSMQMGVMSEVLGPVSLVNTAPAEAPVISKIILQQPSEILATVPSVKLTINNYPEVENITRFHIYRVDQPVDAMSIRTMNLIGSIDMEEEGLLDESSVEFEDTLEDYAGDVPFGNSLLYRVLAERKISYEKESGQGPVEEFAPSKPSKIMMTSLIDTVNPEAPNIEVEYTDNGDVFSDTILKWNKASNNSRYLLFKMNNSGNWEKIYELKNNDDQISVRLSSTLWGSGDIRKADEDGNLIYHRFKVDVINSSGLTNLSENILVI